MSSSKILIPIAIITLLAGAYFFTKKDATAEQSNVIKKTLEIADFTVKATATGELKAKNSKKIRGPRGLRQANIYQLTISDMVAEGTIVKEGDYVAKLDRSELDTKLKDIQTEIEKIETQLAQTEIDTAIELRGIRDQLINLNFSKKEKNYLEFRYIGGADYEKKSDDILYLTERFLMQMWNSCNDSRFNDENKIELQRILNKNKPISDILKDYSKVSEHYPDITILVDLVDNPVIIKLQWERFKNRVVDLIVNGSMTAGLINYDSNYGATQIKDGKFPTVYQLEDFEFIDCEIAGNVTNSSFYGCEITGSAIMYGSLYKGTKVKESKVESSYTHGSCELINCYVAGRDTMFKGKMIGGIFREGFKTKDARFEDTEIVVSKKIRE